MEFLQTEKSVRLIEELHRQLNSCTDLPAILIGFYWRRGFDYYLQADIQNW